MVDRARLALIVHYPLSTIYYLLVPDIPLQVFSHYPAHPPPAKVELWESIPHPCTYLPDRQATMRAFMVETMPPAMYHDFMDANFRRSGKLIYQPSCAGCRECRSIRVPVDRFKMNKSQRRCWRRNQDLSLAVGPPQLTDEKFSLYDRYQRDWHKRSDNSPDDLAEFLYESPVDTVEFEYRDPNHRLLAIGICDVCRRSISSVYFYFDPEASDRSLGTFGVLCEIAHATKKQIPYLYLGYWVRNCRAMHYKFAFKPNEILGADGVWREPGREESDQGNA